MVMGPIRCCRLWLFPVVLFVCLLPLGTVCAAGEEKDGDDPERKWALTLYGGALAQDDIGDVYSFQATFPDDSFIGVAALTREIWRYRGWIGFEVEGQVGKHFGEMHHWEFNGLLLARWHPFPWDRYVETSFAVGDGLSYATEVPELEEEEDEEDAQRLLNYLLFELTLGVPQYKQWDFVIRLHHRSGIFGLFGTDGGANFVTGGIKYKF